MYIGILVEKQSRLLYLRPELKPCRNEKTAALHGFLLRMYSVRNTYEYLISAE